MKKVRAFFKRNFSTVAQADRDARYVLLLLIYIPVLLITTIQALNKGWFDSFERPVFHAVNNLPHFFHYPFLAITQLGTIGAAVVWAAVAYVLVNRRCSLLVLASGFCGWFAAKVLKVFVHRGRPQDLLRSVQSFHTHFSGYGFPSGHATVSAACATIIYYQVAPKYRKYIFWVVVLIGISRMYLGAHFPLDVVGGWSLGIVVGAVISLVFGNSRSSISGNYIRRVLKRRNYEPQTVKSLNLDARGSRPFYIKDKNGNEFFAKLFGSQEHAADWLFKIYRLFRYKNLQAEEPYFNGRRNIEIESLANLWAKKAGVRVPEVIDFIKAGRYWLLVQEKIAADPLCDLKRVSTKALEDSWRQVKKLHAIPMAHRDLRAANILVDKHQNAWLIDFGFAETSPNKQRIHMDNAELLTSMSLVVGVKRTIAAATKILDWQELMATLPYLQKSVFSGATRQGLRQHKDLLKELIEGIKSEVNFKGEVETANIDRINTARLVNVAILGLFIYFVLPQFKQFAAAFGSVQHMRLPFLFLVGIFSLLTYVAAAAEYVSLVDIPLKLRNTFIVQLAASFMTKVIPGGVGGTSLSGRYLIKSGLDPAEASSIVFAQGVIGFAMFTIPLLLLIIISGQSVSIKGSKRDYEVVFIAAVVFLIALLVSYVIKNLRQKVINFIAKGLAQLRDLTTSVYELVLASAASLFITIFYVACLYCSAHAIHLNLSIFDAALAYAAAVIAKSVIPTPGGLGPLEVAMAASLVNAGVDHGQAIATVIIYRLATFWLPIPFSILAYKLAQQRKLI